MENNEKLKTEVTDLLNLIHLKFLLSQMLQNGPDAIVEE